MPRSRTLLAALLAGGLLLSACGGDDDSAAEDTTTTEAADEPTDDTATDDTAAEDGEAIDVCGFIDLDVVNQITGETFTTAEQSEADTCQVTNDEKTALLQLSVKRELDEGYTDESFIEQIATQGCDAGTVVEGIDFSYATAGVACEISGQVALAATHEGEAALLIGRPSDPSLTTEQVAQALNQILQSIVA